MTFTHTSAQADTVKIELRNSALGFIEYGTSTGVYNFSSDVPDRNFWGLLWTGLKTSVNGVSYSWKKTGHSVALASLKPNTTYYYRARGWTPSGEVMASTESSFTTAADATVHTVGYALVG